MLSGDNGILQKATQSKERTEKATVIELAQTDILEKIAENKGETISETQLKTILNKYFEEFDDELPEDLSETTITLTAKEEYGGYTNIALADIYNGNLKIEVLHTYHIEAVGGTVGELTDDRWNQSLQLCWLSSNLYFENKLSRTNSNGNVYDISCVTKK